MKTLVVYYSYEGNTLKLVEAIKEKFDVDVLELKPKKERKTKTLFRFIWGGIQVYMKKKPKLEEYSINLDEYDSIIFGSPCWFGTYAPPINTFISENDIKNKNIYLFVSNGGNLRHTFKDFEKSLIGNNIVSTLELKYPIKTGIEESINKTINWLNKNLIK